VQSSNHYVETLSPPEVLQALVKLFKDEGCRWRTTYCDKYNPSVPSLR